MNYFGNILDCLSWSSLRSILL